MPSSSSASAVVYGKYQLLERLARGGMAEVFKAKSHGVEGFEKILVIKRILPELGANPQFVEMFINEAKIAVTLSHANIVQVFDLGRADEAYFIAMEFVAGMDLATLLRRGRRLGRPLPQELAVYVVSELAKALDYAHRRRDAAMRPMHIVHRDVSPQNVLLSWEGEVKLTDFGIAKARTTVEDETEAGVLKGKYEYMAPEQALGREVDARADLYAVGIVLYEALSGVSPFVSNSPYDTLASVRAGRVRPLEEVAPQVPEELAAIVRRAMSYAPDERHANAGRLYEDLIQFLYASGRRVGAHELSEYLAELRAAGESRAVGSEGDRILAAFDQAETQAPAATPAQNPSGRASARRALTTGLGRQQAAGTPTRPATERRDATVLLVRLPAGDVLGVDAATRIVERFGGICLAAAGHGEAHFIEIISIFGVRDPDGRDTDVAARCGLRLARGAAGAALEGGRATGARIGVVAGRLLVTPDGDPVREERFTELVAAARALVAAGEAGRVRVSAPSERLLRARFELSPAVDAGGGGFVLLAERGFAEVHGKFIGRRDELRRIGEVLALANRGRLRFLTLTGEAGSGKSRLLHETLRRLKLGQHDVGVYLATCTPHGRQVPLSGVQEMVQAILGVDDLDSPVVLREKVARLRELGLSPKELEAVAALFGVEQSAAPGGERPLRTAFVKMATRLAADRLTVLAWDAAESLDEESQALVDALLRAGAESRIAMVLAHRPGLAHPWGDLPGAQSLALGALTDDDVARLVGTRLGAEEVPFELLRDVSAKSGGSPLYVEEYLKGLLDAGAIGVVDGRVDYKRDIADIEVPKSLRGLMAARVARLGPAQRYTLQIAAVVGARFTAELVARVAEERLSDVGGALQLLERRGIVAHQGASEYAFVHELMRDVLLDSLTLEARRALSASVASSIEALYSGRLDELAELLSEHWRDAGDRAKSVGYLVRAADRLEKEHTYDGAIAHIARAIQTLSQIASPDRDRLLALYRRLGDLAFRGRRLDDGARHMAAAIDLAEGLGREEYVARFSVARGRLLAHAMRFDEGRRWLERGREIARRLGEREVVRDAALAEAEAASKNGEQRVAIRALEEALTLARETEDVLAQQRCLLPKALAHAAMGELDAGMAAIDEARRLAGATPDRFVECELLKMESLVCFYARDFAATIDRAQRALELAKEYGFEYETAVNAHNLGEAYLRLGDAKRAFASLHFSFEVARAGGFVKLQMNNLLVLGFIDAQRFGSEDGRQRVLEAIDYAHANAYVWDQLQGKYLLAVIDQQQGHPDDARRWLSEVLRTAAEHNHVRYVEDARQALAALDRGEPIPLAG
jgi:tetratricopeptide (TPR) repeat protein